MNAKILTTATLLIASGASWAQGGGLGIENVDQHMAATQWVQTNGDRLSIIPQGPIEHFDISTGSESMVDTNQYRHSHDDQAKQSVQENDVLAGRPNFIRYLRKRA